MPPTCYNCKQGKRIDKPLFPCSRCGKQFHSACHRPLPKDTRDWTCRKCNSKEPRSRYHEAGSTSSLSTRNSTPTLQHPPAPALNMAPNGSVSGADTVDYVLPSIPCAYKGCKSMTGSGLQLMCDLHIRLLERGPPHQHAAPSKAVDGQHPAPQHVSNGSVLPIMRRKTAPSVSSKAGRSSAAPSGSSPVQANGFHAAQPAQGSSNRGSMFPPTSYATATTHEHANKKVRLNGTEPDYRLNGHAQSEVGIRAGSQPLHRLPNGVNGVHNQQYHSDAASKSHLARPGGSLSRPEPPRGYSGSNGAAPGPMTNGVRSASTGFTNGHRPQGSGSMAVDSISGQATHRVNEYRQGSDHADMTRWFSSGWEKASPGGHQGWPLKTNGVRQGFDRTKPQPKQPQVSADIANGLVRFKDVPHSSAVFQRNAELPRSQSEVHMQRPWSMEPKLSASSASPLFQARSATAEVQRTRQPVSGVHREPPVAAAAPKTAGGLIERRATKVQEPDGVDLDSWIYNQDNASAPPPGVALVPKKEMPTPHDDPYYGHIDPRTHWSRERSQAWHNAKQREIKERGGRKANCGKSAERLAKQRKVVEKEKALSDEVRGNQPWRRALEWAAQCDRQDWEKDKEASRQREIQEQLEADVAGSEAVAAARNRW